MISFYKLFEMLEKKKLLILVHPDCITEVSADAALQYAKLVEQHLPKFDFVITHLFMEDGRPWGYSWNQETKDAHNILVNAVKKHSTKTLFDSRDGYGTSYSTDLPDFLMDNPNTDIYMSGGYESNCLWISYLQLFKRLNWLLKEQGHEVHYYTPLLFSDHEGGGLARTRKYFDSDKAKYAGEFNPVHASSFEPFHPTKVKYKDEIRPGTPSKSDTDKAVDAG